MRERRDKKKVSFKPLKGNRRNQKDTKAAYNEESKSNEDDDNLDQDEDKEGSAEGEKEKAARERRKSARLQTKEEFRVLIKEPSKKRKHEQGDNGSDGE
jgi:hypothetical protein